MTPCDSVLSFVRGPAAMSATSRTTASRRLALGASLGALSMLLAAAPQARATQACAAPIGGTVVCPATGSPYEDGIAYSVEAPAPQDLTLVLPAEAQVVTSADEVRGISVTSSGGAITVSATGTAIETAGSRATGIHAASLSGDIAIDAGTVVTSGYRADGIVVDGGAVGNVSVTADRVSTIGEASVGVRANAGSGDIAIHTSGVYTYGHGSDAIYAASSNGNVTIDTQYAYAFGGSGRGIVAYSSGTTTVHANTVGTSGGGYGTEDDATGVTAVGTAINVDIADSVRTNGDNATGIFARTNLVYSDPTIVPDIAISAGQVATNGLYSHGIIALNYSDGGSTSVTVDRVSTRGDGSFGIYAGGYGDISINAGNVTTLGAGSEAIHAVAFDGNISVNAGAISTGGEGAHGIYAINYGEGSVSVTTGTVKTRRDNAIGVAALSLGDVTVDAAKVETSGFGSQGIVAYSVFGNVTASAEQVVTTGGNATGIGAYAFGEGKTAQIAAGSVETRGDYAVGLLAQAGAGAVSVSASGTVQTAGEHSDGIAALAVALGGGQAVTVTAGTVITSGGGARGIAAQGALGDVSVTVDKVITSGDLGGGRHSTFAEGILAGTTEGTVFIKAGSVETTGRGAVGIDASADFGNIVIDAGTVTTTGLHAAGILAAAREGTTQVTAGNIATSGDYADGVLALSFMLDPYSDADRSIAIKVGTIATSGDFSNGVYAMGVDDITVSAGTITTTGTESRGVYAASLYGDVHVDAGNVTTTGDRATGVFALARYGTASVTAGNVSTSGEEADAIRAGGLGASVSVETIKLAGARSKGIDALAAYGSLDINAGTITGTGETQTAILASAYGGDARIKVGTILMTGYGATGISAFTEQGGVNIAAGSVTVGEGGSAIGVGAYVGDASVTVGTVSSGGTGVFATTAHGDVTVNAGTITTTGEFGKAVYTNANGGNSTVTLSGAVTTSGTLAVGVQATTVGGDNVIVNGKSLTTAGDYAYGLIGNTFVGNVRITSASVKTSGEHASGIRGLAVGPYTSVTVNAQEVVTTGDKADGIVAQAPDDILIPFLVPANVTAGTAAKAGAPAAGVVDQSVTVTAGGVKVTGAGSVGIRVRAAGDFAIDAANVSAADGNAILAEAHGQGALTVRGQIVSQGEAVNLKGEDLAVTIAKGGSVTGGSDAIVVAAVGPYVPPPPAEGEDGGGIGIGLRAPAPAVPVVTVSNAGTINGGTGYALRVDSGTLDLTNSGTITGRLRLNDGDDRITNTGTFAASGDSDFGAGNDRFVNSGTVRILPGAAKAGTVHFLGLERFENAGGTIDMANGHVGDSLVLPGEYVGSNGARLALEIGGGAADRLTVQGAATGSTALVLTNFDGAGAKLLGDRQIALVSVGAGSSATAFTLANGDFGFVHYDVEYDAGNRTFELASSAGAPIHRLAKLNEAMASSWNKGVATVTGHLANLRDGAAATGKRLWGTFAGDTSRLRQSRGYAGGAASDAAMQLGYNQSNVEARLGYELGDAGAVAKPGFGVTAAYVSSTVNFAGSASRVSVDSFDVGGYGRYQSGGLFVNGLVDVQFHHLKASDRRLDYRDTFSGTTFGGALEVGARLSGGAFFLEPSAQLAWSRTDLGDLSALDQKVAFANGQSLRGTFGARFGGSSGNTTVYGGLHYLHEFDGKSGATLSSGGSRDSLSSLAIEDVVRGSLGVSIANDHGLTGFFEANGDVGSGRRGGGGRVGIRFSF